MSKVYPTLEEWLDSCFQSDALIHDQPTFRRLEELDIWGAISGTRPFVHCLWVDQLMKRTFPHVEFRLWNVCPWPRVTMVPERKALSDWQRQSMLSHISSLLYGP